MPAGLSDSVIARLLPGSWSVAATNLPFWLSGSRVDPQLRYGLLSESPLRFSDVVSYRTDAGVPKTIVGVDRSRNGAITWRGKGLLGLIASHWAVTGANESGTVLAIQYDKTIATPAGIDILVRDGASEPEVRSIVAANAKQFGLTLEDFASLYWFGAVGRGA